MGVSGPENGPRKAADNQSAKRMITRREMLRGTGAALGALTLGQLLAACSSPTAATTTAGGSSTTVAGAVTSTAGGATTSAPAAGGILKLAFKNVSPAESLDPALSFNFNMSVLNSLYHESLVDVDENWNPIPLLAEDFEVNSDATQYRFRIRDGIVFHNGKTLTAEDAAFSLRRLLDANLGSPLYAPLSKSMTPDGIVAVDPTTLELNLSRPDSYLAATLSSRRANIVPDGTTVFEGIGTGPFMSVSWVAGESYEAERNPNYWREGLPRLDGVQGVGTPEDSTKIQSILNGDVHIGDPIDPSLLETMEGDPNGQILIQENAADYRFTFQTDTFDVKVVQAIKAAIDRQGLIDLALAGYGIPAADVPAFSDQPWHPDGGVPSPDPAKAMQLLQEAGFGDGLDITLNTSDVFGGFIDSAVVLKEQLAPIGINITVAQIPVENYWSDVWVNEPASMVYWPPDVPYFMASVGFTGDGPANESHFHNADYEALLEQASATVDTDARNAIMKDAYTILQRESGDVIWCFGHLLWPAKAGVSGVKFGPVKVMDLSEATIA